MAHPSFTCDAGRQCVSVCFSTSDYQNTSTTSSHRKQSSIFQCSVFVYFSRKQTTNKQFANTLCSRTQHAHTDSSQTNTNKHKQTNTNKQANIENFVFARTMHMMCMCTVGGWRNHTWSASRSTTTVQPKCCRASDLVGPCRVHRSPATLFANCSQTGLWGVANRGVRKQGHDSVCFANKHKQTQTNTCSQTVRER